MGKRSRKRTGSATGAATATDTPSTAGTTRAERDAARRRRAAAVRERADAPERRPTRRSPRGERPPAPWGSFPLVEICVLLSIVLLVWGFVSGGNRGATMVFAGLA